MVSPVSVPVSATVDQRTMGHYVIVAELGCGALGMVYGAEDLKTARKVALRVFTPELPEAELADVRARFMRAAYEAERLNHPNIVTLHEVGTFAGGAPYIATELLIGLTLRESIDGGIVFPLHKVIDVAMLILRGLDYAHQQGVVHRDLKPANVMLAHNGMVKIMDFAIGLAVERGPKRSPAMPAAAKPGALAYRAPEQVGAGTVDARSDLFALGVILYEMLTGIHPFAGDNATAVAHLAPPAPTTLNPDLPPALDGVIMQAIANDPGARFASAREMSRTLAPICAQLKDDRNPNPAHEARTGAGGGHAEQSAAAPATTSLSAAAPAPAPSMRKPLGVLAGAAVLVAVLVLSQRMGTRDDAASDRVDALTPVIVTRAGDPSSAAVAATPAPAAPPPTTVTAGDPEPMAANAMIDLAAAEPELEAGPSDTPAPAPSAALVPAPAAESESGAEPEPESAPTSGSKPAVPVPGKLGLRVLPWGEVYVNGRRRGVTPPLRELALPPGTHRIEIRNADLPPYVQRLTIRSGQSISIRHRFQ